MLSNIIAAVITVASASPVRFKPVLTLTVPVISEARAYFFNHLFRSLDAKASDVAKMVVSTSVTPVCAVTMQLDLACAPVLLTNTCDITCRLEQMIKAFYLTTENNLAAVSDTEINAAVNRRVEAFVSHGSDCRYVLSVCSVRPDLVCDNSTFSVKDAISMALFVDDCIALHLMNPRLDQTSQIRASLKTHNLTTLEEWCEAMHSDAVMRNTSSLSASIPIASTQ